MAESKTYTGSCHCGNVRYEVQTSLEPLIACNCSICAKSGMVLTFVPQTAFKLISGAGDLTDYQFGKKAIHHLFCKTCGVRSFGRGAAPDGTEMLAINVRCLDGVDVTSLNPAPFDGKSL